MQPTDLDRWVELHKEEMLSFLSRLVRIRTENRPPEGNEWPGQEALSAEMISSGMEVDMFTPDKVPELREHPAFFGTVDGLERNYERRPNLVGTLKGSGGGQSLMITGHMDTVIGDSVSGDIVEGKLYGRGAYDMKAGLVCGLYAIKAVQALNIPLRGDVLLESVVDEEYGGANGTLASRLRGYQANIAICPEPTNMNVCHEHLGWLSYKITVEGADGISFSGEAVENPIYLINELVAAIKKYEQLYPRQFSALLPESMNRLPVYIMQMHTGGLDYTSVMGIPKQATMMVGLTTCLGLTEEMVSHDFEWYLRNHIESRGLDWSRISFSHPIRYIHPSGIDAEHPFFASLKNVYRRRLLPEPPIVPANLACDAFISNLYFNTPTIIFGPGGANAHAGNEYVHVDDVIELTKRFAALIVEWCA